jgi:hypothetical protein
MRKLFSIGALLAASFLGLSQPRPAAAAEARVGAIVVVHHRHHHHYRYYYPRYRYYR